MSRLVACASLLLALLASGCAVADHRCDPPRRLATPVVDPTLKPSLAKASPEPVVTTAPVTTKAIVVVKATPTRPSTAPLARRPRAQRDATRFSKSPAPQRPAPTAPAVVIAPTPTLATAVLTATAVDDAPAPPPTPAPARAPFAAPPPARDPLPVLGGERAAMIFAIAALAVGTLAIPLLLRRAPSFGRAPMRFGAYLLLIVRRFFRR